MNFDPLPYTQTPDWFRRCAIVINGLILPDITPSSISTNAIAMGTSTASGSTSPLAIDMGGTFSTTAGGFPKLRLFNDGIGVYGIGVSNTQLDYMAPTGATHNFYIDGTKYLGVTTTGINLPTGTGLYHNSIKVVGAQGAAVADATDAASAITQLNALLARCRAHGLIA